MKTANACLAGSIRSRRFWTWVTLTVIALAIAACGGGTGTDDRPVSAQCIPDDPSSAAECGTLIVGLTDADGEFLSYSVDVVSLTLERADGETVETLPAETRVDFSEYVDMTELLAVATMPPGIYVAGTITLDYSNAQIFVDVLGEATEAIVVDDLGNPLTQTSVTIDLAESDRIFISKGSASLLSVDFDLEASHGVNIVPNPAIATAEPFIVAEIDPVDAKDFRVRGLLVEVNEAEMWYSVRLRPFHRRTTDFGRMRVHVTDDTECELNDASFKGSDCLNALSAAGRGTLTVAQGTLNVGDRRFTANIVLAGSSVPGHEEDGAKGTVIARVDNELTVHGAIVMLTDAVRPAFFRDDITVTVGPDTIVYRTHVADRPLGIADSLLDISAISPGQVVTVRGTVTANDENGVHIDATEGAVLLHVTRLTGMVKAIMTGQVDIDLHTIGRVRAGAVDFTCTGGCEPGTDADPENYEVSVGDLFVTMATDATGRPVAAWGFPAGFGAAPPDFFGRTVTDYSVVGSALGIGWGADGTTAPFLMMNGTGLLLDNKNAHIDQRHYIKQGPVLIDLRQLATNTLIAPRETGRMLFVLKTPDSLQQYAAFDDFVTALMLSLDGVNAARSLYARGHYNADSNVFAAYKIFVYILEP